MQLRLSCKRHLKVVYDSFDQGVCQDCGAKIDGRALNKKWRPFEYPDTLFTEGCNLDRISKPAEYYMTGRATYSRQTCDDEWELDKRGLPL